MTTVKTIKNLLSKDEVPVVQKLDNVIDWI